MNIGNIDTALITGGAGFIGSNLAIRLSDHDIDITILDSMNEEYGGNQKNLKPIAGDIELRVGDIRDKDIIRELIKDVDIIFHLAAQLSRPISMNHPEEDIDINCRGTINLLEALRKHNPQARFVYTGSQATFGKPTELPITEETADKPVDIYGANKLAAEHYGRIYNSAHGIPTVSLRLTNVYGPRAQLSNPNYGVINKFLRRALEDKILTVYEPGTMRRDPIFVDDVTDALVRAAIEPDAVGKTFVIGSCSPVSIRHLAEQIVEIVETGRVEMTDWPDDWASIRVGDIYVNPDRAYEVLGWEPRTELDEGLRQTVDFYQQHKEAYLFSD